ncbi:cyclophilin-like fold protein [Xanthomonas sp. NCPPB 1754]|uniref:cyclophilin-like fold protein n=1 Tax=Xanthomonas sp. NCPPB 1754 TaxID=487536 RepID=UPI00355707B8
MKKSSLISRQRLWHQTQMLFLVSILGLVACGGSSSAAATDGASPGLSQELPLKIRLSVAGQEAIATLDDSPSARDFATQLPLTLTLTDYARIERIAVLPQKIPRSRAQSSVPVRGGDLAYYAPWGNLAIFVENGTGNYTADLMRLGRVETGLAILQRPGPFEVRIERVAD